MNCNNYNNGNKVSYVIKLVYLLINKINYDFWIFYLYWMKHLYYAYNLY